MPSTDVDGYPSPHQLPKARGCGDGHPDRTPSSLTDSEPPQFLAQFRPRVPWKRSRTTRLDRQDPSLAPSRTSRAVAVRRTFRSHAGTHPSARRHVPSAVATRDKRRNATGRATCARGRGGRRPRSTPAAPRKPRRSVRGNDVQSVEKILQWSVATNRPPSSPASRASEGRWIHVSSADDTIVTMDHDRHH